MGESQGYITIATGDRSYVEMAEHLALSVRLNDSRPIALITDENTTISDSTRALFSDVIIMPAREGYVGCMNKLRVFNFTPFEETIFIDADCLLIKADMDRHWDRFSDHDVNFLGEKLTSGNWYHFDIENVLSALDIPYIVKMNSGLFYFKKNASAHAFFDCCLNLVESQAEVLGCSHRVAVQLADEPFFGAVLGMQRIDPVVYSPEEGSAMITTVHAKNCRFDPITHESQVYKPTSFRILGRFWAKSWVNGSPSVAHFVKLKPRSVYDSACLQLRFNAQTTRESDK